ncbi:hypothetical protein BDV30DRAFT_208625, partial [Aspergillus minisclerotigenes]
MRTFSPNPFKSVIDIDVLGSYNTVKAALLYLIARASKNRPQNEAGSVGIGGRINCVSTMMHYIGTPRQSHSCTAKAAVDAVAHAVCIEQGPLGVTSSVISPEPIADSEGISRVFSKCKQTLTGKTPSGRQSTVRGVADATIYLFSEAESYINREILVVDGGRWHTNCQPTGRVVIPGRYTLTL